MFYCPKCKAKRSILDLHPVMDELSKHPIKGEYVFNAKCCSQQIRAYSHNGTYYLAGNPDSSDEGLTQDQVIGRA